MRRARMFALLVCSAAAAWLAVRGPIDAQTPAAEPGPPRAEPGRAERPLLAGPRRACEAEGGTTGEWAGGPPPPGAGRREDLLRRVEGTILASVAWTDADLADVLADLTRGTGVAFRLSSRAQEATSRRAKVVLAGTHLALAAVLEHGIAEPLGLEWEVREGHVWLGRLGEGPEVLARELADMALHGTRTEQMAAEDLLRSAPAGLRGRTEALCLLGTALRERNSASPSAAETTSEAAGSSGRIRVTWRLLTADDAVARDLGIGPLGPDDEPRILPPACRSGVAWLDDTQREVLERCAAQGERIRSADAGTLWSWAGEERVVDVAHGGVLTLRCKPIREGRYLHLRMRLRFLDGAVMRFVPGFEVPLPSGGTLLVSPADGEPWSVGADRVLLLLDAEVVP